MMEQEGLTEEQDSQKGLQQHKISESSTQEQQYSHEGSIQEQQDSHESLQQIMTAISEYHHREKKSIEDILEELKTRLTLDEEWKTLSDQQYQFRHLYQLTPKAYLYLLDFNTSCSKYIEHDWPKVLPSNEPDTMGKDLREAMTTFHTLGKNSKGDVIDMTNLSPAQQNMIWFYRNEAILSANRIKRINTDEHNHVKFKAVIYSNEPENLDLNTILSKCDSPCPFATSSEIEYWVYL